MSDADKVRHTLHLEKSVLEKFRDVVAYLQKHPEELPGVDAKRYGNLSRFAETAIVKEILRLERKRKKEFPKRRKNEGVHFGRPPISE